MANPTEKSDYTFRLFAPNNKTAALIADFNDWKEIPMEKSGGGYFETTQKLADGVYQYRFVVASKSWFYEPDEPKTITDPYATEVDPKTQNSVLKLKNGVKIVDEYIWRHNDAPLPTNNELIIYEMHIGDFSGGENDPFRRGKYPNVVEKINYLNELGINAVELMPVKESPGEYSWGYSPVNYFAADSSYGTSAQLKEMIDALHRAGVRVILDGVYNHANTDSPLAQIDHDYWFRREPRDKKHNWGPEFSYEYFDEKIKVSPARKFIHDSLRFWISEYQIDGVRYDAAIQIGDFDVMREFVEITRAMSPMKPFLNIAEYLPPDPALVSENGPMDCCWNDSFMHIVTKYLTGETFNLEEIKDAIDCRRLGFGNSSEVVNYLANHDHERLFNLLGENGFFGEEAHLRARLGAMMLLTSAGIPLIWMGEEFGEYREKSTESSKIDWNLLEKQANKNLFEFYKTLIELRKSVSAFRASNVEFFHENANAGVLAFQRFDEEGSVAVVVLNLSNDDLENYEIKNFPDGENWHEWTKDYDTQIKNNSINLNLPRRVGLIFVKS